MSPKNIMILVAGGEQSGHIIFRDDSTTGDGLLPTFAGGMANAQWDPRPRWYGAPGYWVGEGAISFALFLFVLKYKSVTSLYVYALFFGFTQLVTAPLAPMLAGHLYGFRYIGILSGVINTIHFLGGGFWTYATGLIFDRTGSYQLAFALSAIMAMTAVLCAIFIVEKRHHAVS